MSLRRPKLPKEVQRLNKKEEEEEKKKKVTKESHAKKIPVGVRFSAPVQTTLGLHPASYTMGTGSFPGVKRPGRGVDHPPPSSAVKERVEL